MNRFHSQKLAEETDGLRKGRLNTKRRQCRKDIGKPCYREYGTIHEKRADYVVTSQCRKDIGKPCYRGYGTIHEKRADYVVTSQCRKDIGKTCYRAGFPKLQDTMEPLSRAKVFHGALTR